MKVKGILSAWACENYIQPVIENHLKLCDELYVLIEPYHIKFEKFIDDTKDIVEHFCMENNNVKLLSYGRKKKGDRYESVRCGMLNYMLEYANVEPGDILMISDADEFYDNAAITELQNEFTKDDWDCLQIEDRFFVINKNWYVQSNGGHYRFFRVKGFDDEFIPCQKWTPEPKIYKKVLQANPMFHYSMLMNAEFKKTHWSLEANKNPSKLKWLDEIYDKWDPYNASLCSKLSIVNEKITGNKGFWFNSGVIEEQYPPFITEYEGEHPFNKV